MSERKMNTDELIRLIGSAFYSAVTAVPEANIDGWTSVEAFAKITGMTIRLNASPGRESHVFEGAVQAMKEGFDTLQQADFLGLGPTDHPAKDHYLSEWMTRQAALPPHLVKTIQTTLSDPDATSRGLAVAMMVVFEAGRSFQAEYPAAPRKIDISTARQADPKA